MRELIFRSHVRGGGWNWRQRAQVLDAVVRAFLREDILLRLPKEVFRGEDETWSESLLRGLHQEPGGPNWSRSRGVSKSSSANYRKWARKSVKRTCGTP